ncbi:hypothetical protein EVAR_23083_1 [Eumeta japonica]|uniref:Uncharacterized protein n=1 Tax=Eumeta variegata TaxID=151549 RepID=A0A4C1VN36_EUMVA|nr:hypothetical protein EVAR_23083_1 [Eumeta japonica]
MQAPRRMMDDVREGRQHHASFKCTQARLQRMASYVSLLEVPPATCGRNGYRARGFVYTHTPSTSSRWLLSFMTMLQKLGTVDTSLIRDRRRMIAAVHHAAVDRPDDYYHNFIVVSPRGIVRDAAPSARTAARRRSITGAGVTDTS